MYNNYYFFTEPLTGQVVMQTAEYYVNEFGTIFSMDNPATNLADIDKRNVQFDENAVYAVSFEDGTAYEKVGKKLITPLGNVYDMGAAIIHAEVDFDENEVYTVVAEDGMTHRIVIPSGTVVEMEKVSSTKSAA